MIDLHCHVLAGLDDGPQQIDDATKLVVALRDLGFSELHPTPHQTAHSWAPSPAECQTAAAKLRTALDRRGCTVRIASPAGENMWDDLFLSRQFDRSFPTYAGQRAFLLEFPPDNLPALLPQRLFDLRLDGMLPVIAHVERYPALCADPTVLEGRAAVLLNLASLGSGAAWGYRARLRRMVADGRVHALATDAHALADVRAAASGLKWLRKNLGDQAVERLLVAGPRQILAGEIPESG